MFVAPFVLGILHVQISLSPFCTHRMVSISHLLSLNSTRDKQVKARISDRGNLESIYRPSRDPIASDEFDCDS